VPISGRVLWKYSASVICMCEGKIVEELTLLVFEKKPQVFMCFRIDI